MKDLRLRVSMFLLVTYVFASVADARRPRRPMIRVANVEVPGSWCVHSQSEPGELFEASFVAPTTGRVRIELGGYPGFDPAFVDNFFVVESSVLEDDARSFTYNTLCFQGCDEQPLVAGTTPLCTSFIGANNEAPRVPVFEVLADESVVDPESGSELGRLTDGAGFSLFPLVEVFSNVPPSRADCDPPLEDNEREQLGEELPLDDGWCFYHAEFSDVESATEDVRLGEAASVEMSLSQAGAGALALLETDSGICADASLSDKAACVMADVVVSALEVGERYTVLTWLKMDTQDNQHLWIAVDEGLTPPAGTRGLKVQTGGKGSGTVEVCRITDPNGTEVCEAVEQAADCGPGCVENEVNEPVTLRAVPEAGSAFLGWSGACAGIDRSGVVPGIGPDGVAPSVPSCDLVMNEDKQVTAIFEVQEVQFEDFSRPGLPLIQTCLDFFGQTCIGQGGASETLVLTPDAQHVRGSAWFSQKVPLAEGFETIFEFRIENDGVDDIAAGSPADGLAFVVQTEAPDALGDAEGSGMGYVGMRSSLAVEFDTYPPADLGGRDHISIQSGGVGPNGWTSDFSLGQWTLDALSGFDEFNDPAPTTLVRTPCGPMHCAASPPFSKCDCKILTARIRYLPGLLEVYFGKLRTPLLTGSVDLENIYGGSILDPEGEAWVGFTAATGDSASKHEIVRWSLTSLDPDQHRPFAPRLPLGNRPLNDTLAFISISGPAVENGLWKFYFVDVPAGAESLTIRLSDQDKDVDLYLRAGGIPGLGASESNCAPRSRGTGDEVCSVQRPVSGRWWIGVTNFATTNLSATGFNYTLQADVSIPDGGGGSCVEDLANGVACLQNGRFRLETTYFRRGVLEHYILDKLNDEVVLGFYNHQPTNLVTMQKVRDNCEAANVFTFWWGGITLFESSVDLTDLRTGTRQFYTSPAGGVPESIRDATWSCN